MSRKHKKEYKPALTPPHSLSQCRVFAKELMQAYRDATSQESDPYQAKMGELMWQHIMLEAAPADVLVINRFLSEMGHTGWAFCLPSETPIPPNTIPLGG